MFVGVMELEPATLCGCLLGCVVLAAHKREFKIVRCDKFAGFGAIIWDFFSGRAELMTMRSLGRGVSWEPMQHRTFVIA